MPTITLPNNWQPRWYQRDAWDYMEAGGRHLELVAHRRWGKDDIALHRAAIAMFEKPATYWHMLPLANQVRKAIWDAVNPHTGHRRIDEAFPDELFQKRENDMFIRCRHNGATWQALGSDNYQGSIGSPPFGIVWSEWAQSNPSARGYLRPIIAENKGWEVYITTPRGRNHAYKTFKQAMNTQGAKALLYTAKDTDVFDDNDLEIERQEYIATYGQDMGNALFMQEYMCSFDAAILGAYYASELADLEKEGRITRVEHQEGFPVYTAWDLGYDDDTAIWWYQIINGEIRILEYYFASGKNPDHYASQLLGKEVFIDIVHGKVEAHIGADIEELKHRQAYEYATLWLPHDAQAKTFAASGKSIQEQLAAVFGWKLIDIVPRLSLEDGIQAARKTLPRCVFDVSCEEGIEALKQYQREWDDDKKQFRDKPRHDWTSHPADAFRYLAVAWEERKPKPGPEQTRFPVERTINELVEAQRKKRLAMEDD